jgi:glycosyltransferase involved in cell wall biosynthesis
VISPRGELDAGALGIKRWRKRLFLSFVRFLRLYDDAVWHVTSPDEVVGLTARLGADLPVVVAPNIPGAVGARGVRPPKEAGQIDLLFLSRISRKKNLLFVIEALMGAKGDIQLDVLGPIEDLQYWQQCQRAAESLPANVRFRYAGVANPDEVPDILARHHLFVLPTLSENFGHAIVEALLAGCPVLISDQTPWHALEPRRAGWDLPLSDVAAYRRVIDLCVDMASRQFEEWSDGARQLGLEIAAKPEAAAYVSLFNAALAAQLVRRSSNEPATSYARFNKEREHPVGPDDGPADR